MTARKNKSLLELSRLGRGLSVLGDDDETRERLVQLRRTLDENHRVLALHIRASEEIATLIAGLDHRTRIRRHLQRPDRAGRRRPMIKLIGVGLWVCLVALGSSYFTAEWTSNVPPPPAPKQPTFYDGLDYRKTDDITIPMISHEAIQGYILARFVYTIDGNKANKLKVPPDPFILDEAFRRLYSTDSFDFDKPERFDITALTAAIKDAVNKRYGEDLIYEVLVDQFDYIPKQDIRNGHPANG